MTDTAGRGAHKPGHREGQRARQERDISRPIFIVCTARSGSTLLRVLIGSHPNIASFPETNLSAAFEAIAFSAKAVNKSSKKHAKMTRSVVRKVASEILGDAAIQRGKVRWCEKSLSTLDHIELIHQVFPQAQFIFLFRHCFDFVYSGIEASPWGFKGYGFQPFIAANPQNTIRALSLYWIERTRLMILMRNRFLDSSFSTTYEQLVANPESTMREIYEFLEETWHPIPDNIRDVYRTGKQTLTEHGDFKIPFTQSIETSSIGRGNAKLPLGMLDESVLSEVNSLLTELEYDKVDPLEASMRAMERNDALVDSTSMAPTVELVLKTILGPAIGNQVPDALGSAGKSWLRLLVGYGPVTRTYFLSLRTGAMTAAHKRATLTAYMDVDTFFLVARGQESPGSAIREARIRWYGKSDDGPTAELQCLADEAIPRFLGFLYRCMPDHDISSDDNLSTRERGTS